MKSSIRICPQCGLETTALTCRNDGFGTVDADRYRRNDPGALIGTLFQDRYRVEEVLGSGGMGSVYRATQIRVGRQVALKVINATLAWELDVVARFQREGRAIAGLIHPNIVQVYDFGQSDDGQLFMAMELVSGRTLARLIEEEAPIDAARVINLGTQILDALAEAHEHGVVHRDLKPQNIFVTQTGRRADVVKILDFGVAKVVNEPKSESMVTSRGAILGSPRYMAPEQARGKGVTGHADLYAVGGILYELLTGQPVFNEPSPADYLVAHSVKMPPPPMVGDKEVRGPLVDLIMRLLEKKPWNRPDGAGRALEMLEACRLAPIIEPSDKAAATADGAPTGGSPEPRRLFPSATLVREAPEEDSGPTIVAATEVAPPPLPEPSNVAPLPQPDVPAPRAALITLPPTEQANDDAVPVGPSALDFGSFDDVDDDRLGPASETTRPVSASDQIRPRRGAAGRLPVVTRPEGLDRATSTGTNEVAAIPLIVKRQSDPTLDFEAPPDKPRVVAEGPRVVFSAPPEATKAKKRKKKAGAGRVWLLAALILIAVGIVLWALPPRHPVSDPGAENLDRVSVPADRGAVAGPSGVESVGPSLGEVPGDDAAREDLIARAEAQARAKAAADREAAVAAEAEARAQQEAEAAAAAKAAEEKAAQEAAEAAKAAEEAKAAEVKAAETNVKAAEANAKAAEEKAKAAAEAKAKAAADKRRADASEVDKVAAALAAQAAEDRARAAAVAKAAEERAKAAEAAAKAAEPKQQVTVESRPSGATVFRGSRALGTTPLTVSVAQSDPPMTVELKSDGYRPYRITLPREGAIKVILLPAAAPTAQDED